MNIETYNQSKNKYIMIERILGITLGVVLSLCSASVVGQNILPVQLQTSTSNNEFQYRFDFEKNHRYSVQPINVKFQLNGVDEDSSTDKQTKPRRRLLWIGLGVLAVGSLAASAGGGGSGGSGPDFPPIINDGPTASRNVTSADTKNSSIGENTTIKDSVDLDRPQRGVFLSVGTNSVEKRQSTRTRESSAGTTQFAIGYDQLLNSKTLIGVLIDLSSSDITFAGFEDTTDSTSRSILAFANYERDELLAIFGYVGVSTLGIDNTRFPGSSALNFTDASGNPIEVLNIAETQIAGAANGTVRKSGVSFSKGVLLPQGTQIDTHLDLDYSNTEIESYSEDGNSGVELRFPRQTARTFAFRLGVQASKAISLRSGVLVPQAGIDIIKESIKRSTVNSVLLTDQNVQSEIEPEPTDDSYSLANIGFAYINASRVQFFGKLQKSFRHSFEDRTGLSAGIRIAF